MNEFFYKLTPDIIIKAVEQKGFEPSGHFMILNSFENRVFDLRLEDNSHIITKFYRPGRWTKEQIEEEHKFLLQLEEDEIPVCAPLYIDEENTVDETENIFFAIWARTGGRSKDELSDSDLQILGRLLARIHNRGAANPAVHRIKLTAENYAIKPLHFLEENNFLPTHCKKRYSDTVKEIAKIYEELSQGIPTHRIHGDCHLGNLLKNNEKWYFLDFDDFLTGPAVQDIWMLLPARDSEGLRQRNLFLNSYREFRDFDSSWLKLIEPLRALRYIHYAAWIAKRWDDPAFPPAFPHFGTESYWEEETADLEKQLEYIYKQNENDILLSPQAPNTEPEVELTNKDYFWDM